MVTRKSCRADCNRAGGSILELATKLANYLHVHERIFENGCFALIMKVNGRCEQLVPHILIEIQD